MALGGESNRERSMDLKNCRLYRYGRVQTPPSQIICGYLLDANMILPTSRLL